jgi:hypothetical protein
MDAGGLFFLAATSLPSIIAGSMIGVLAKAADSNPLSSFHRSLFVGVVWSFVLSLLFSSAIKTLMTYISMFIFLLILSTSCAFISSLFFWGVLWGINSFWRVIQKHESS